MKKKQTAVQWLSERLIDILGDKCNNLTQEQTLANHYAFKQALQMEREQIEEAYMQGDMISFGKQCFYKGFNKCKNDDANSFTLWREEGGILIKNIQQPKSWEVKVEEVNGAYKVLSIV